MTQNINTEYQKNIKLVSLREQRTGEYILTQLIEQAFNIFCNKFSNGGITANNEFGFQFEFGSILKILGQLYEFKTEDQFHLSFESNHIIKISENKKKKARIDLFIEYIFNGKLTRVAIEIKFFKKSNHREPNNRYDVFKDLIKLETYKESGIEMCYFLLVTDHEHYVSQETYSADTSDFDFRDGKKYTANTVLEYKTAIPYGESLVLKQDYNFNWKRNEKFYFLLLPI